MANDYTLNWSNNGLKSPISLGGGSQDSTTTSLTLTGKGSINWGEPLQENLLRLLENFASSVEPPNPTIGQLWFNPVVQTLFVCYAVSPLGVASWSTIYSISNIALVAAPLNPVVGQLWFDVTNLVLKHWAGSSWIPIYSASSLTSEVAPTNPLVGQLWFKASTKRMSIYNGTGWAYLFSGDAISSSSAPLTPARGSLWFDTTNNTLKIFDNTNVFVPVAGSSGFVFDGTYYTLDGSIKITGMIIANGFAFNQETQFTFASTQTINFGTTNLYAGTLTGNSVVTLSASFPGHYQLRINQDGTGGRTIVWQNVAGWLGAAAAPALASTPNAVTFINFFRTQSGLWYGQLIKVGS